MINEDVLNFIKKKENNDKFITDVDYVHLLYKENYPN
jgi:hypothetical protein